MVDARQFPPGSAQLFVLPEMSKIDFAKIHSWRIPSGLSRLPGVFLPSSCERCK
jgi:hypothetical protein